MPPLNVDLLRVVADRTYAIGLSMDQWTALLASRAYTATASADVQVGGYPAKRVDLQLPSGTDFAACDKVAGQAAGLPSGSRL